MNSRDCRHYEAQQQSTTAQILTLQERLDVSYLKGMIEKWRENAR